MELFRNTKIDFIGRRYQFYILSFLMLAASAAVLVIKGPVLGIEFTGGTLLQVKFNDLPPIEKIRDSLSNKGWQGFALQTQPTDKSVIIRVKTGDKSKEDIAGELLNGLQLDFQGNVHSLPERVEFVGPSIGKKLIINAFKAIFGSFFVIIIYVAIRFKNWIWGAVGVVALMHDVFITLGLIVFLEKEITLVVISALLTLAGYSINDTIVIFDRVRENFQISRKETLQEIYNRSINETLSRTINTAFAALLAALSLVFVGGEVIRDFSLAMTFGIIIGSYSTIGVAIGLIYQLEQKAKRN